MRAAHDRHRSDPPRPDLRIRQAGLLTLGQALAATGVEILSTGGSAKALREAGIAVVEVSDHTGFPEILDGRVKTLVPQIHGGLLGRRDLPEHVAQMAAHGIAPIDLLVSNLYPFEARSRRGAAYDECVENIDIGGPAMIRAAAKNHDFVAVVTDLAQYGTVLARIRRPAAPHWRCAVAWRPRPMRAPPPTTRPSPRGSPASEARRSPTAWPSPARCARRCAMARTRTSGRLLYHRRRARASPRRGRCRARSCRTTT